jgi:hypothetical protein
LTEESSRDQLIRSVASRLNQASSTGNFAVTREPVAQREAGELMGYLATAGGVDPQVQYLLGMLHLMRMIADPQAEQDAVIAMTLLAPFYLNLPGTPDLLPAPIRNQLDQVLGSAARQADTAELTQQHAESLADLGVLLLRRRAAGGDGVAGRAAISVLRQAAGDLGADRPSRAVILCNLGYALIATDPQPGELAEAVTVLREAFGRTSPDDANYARCANGLGLALLGASGITPDRSMLAEAADKLRIATSNVPETEPNLPQMLSDLGLALMACAKSAEHGQAADSGPAEEAVTVLRRAADCLSAQDPRRPEVLLRYADALITIGRPEEATRLLVGNDAASPSSPQAQQAGPVLLRAAMIARQLERDRDPEQEALRDWLDKTSASLLENSGNVLAVLWRLIGGEADPADQSRHADLMRLVKQILATPDDVTAMPGFVAKVMETVRRRFDDLPPGERDEALADYLKTPRERNAARTAATPPADTSSLDELLKLHERLLPELAPGSREELMITNGRRLIKAARIQLTLASRDAASQLPQWRDLEPLIKEITEKMPEDLTRLGIAPGTIEARAAFAHAFSPYELLARMPEWIQEIRHRLGGFPPDTPEVTEARTTLAIMLFLFATVSSDEASFEKAQDIARDLVTTAWPLSAVLLSGWARAQSQRLRLAALTASLPDPAGQSSHPLTRLASDQAVRSMEEHDPTGALETLEEGRSQFLSRAVNTRSELEALRGADAQLHSRLLTVLDEITAMQRTGALAGRLATPEEGTHVQELMNEGTRLVAGLKQRPGFSRFLIPSPLGLADLRPAAAGGPVITLNVNPRRCDALILHPDGPPRHVPLNRLTAAGLAEQAGSFRAAVKNLLVSHPSSPQAASARSDFDAVLGWLWDALAEPVLKALGFNEPPGLSTPLPRIWWSPTGVLNSLPLHAAGHHDQPGTSVLDCAVSSYTPTLRALMLARARSTRQQRHGQHQGELRRVLAVAMPDTAGYNPLTRTVEEATAAAGRDGLKLIGADASQAEVLSALPGAAVTHFACHASSDPEDPAASHLLLHDGPLPVREIAALRLDDAQLAYLSACGTSRGGTSLADEAIHLAAAFQLAGYTQTVGTLWEVGDTFAAAAAAKFHRILAPDMASSAPLPAASALHATMRHLRDIDRNPQDHPRDLQPWAWTALVHAGA